MEPMAPLDVAPPPAHAADGTPDAPHHAHEALENEPAVAALRTWTGWLRVAFVLQGLAAAALVASAGEPGWRLVRAGVVALIWWGAAVLTGRGPLWRIAVRLVLGAVGAGVGLAIALSHLDQAMGVGGIVGGIGVVLLLTSLGLLGAGAVRGLQRLRLAGRLVVAPLGLVLLLVLWSVLVPAVAATNVGPIPADDRTPADVGLEFEEIVLRTDDATLLAAWHVPTEDGAAVILLHGAGSTRSDVLDEAEVLADAGYGVVIPDAAGHGDSGGQAMDLGWLGDQEVEAAVSFVAEEPAVDDERIGVVGLSMGGEQAIGAAAADDRVRAVVAEGVTGRQVADEEWYADEYGVRGSLQVGLEWLQTQLTDLLTTSSPPTPLADGVAGSDAAFLVISAGTVDDEGRVAERLQAQAPDRVEVWDVPGAPHVGGLDEDPEGWRQQIVSFLDQQLG
jgi:dienelactone hydrolase